MTGEAVLLKYARERERENRAQYFTTHLLQNAFPRGGGWMDSLFFAQYFCRETISSAVLQRRLGSAFEFFRAADSTLLAYN